MGWNPEKDRAPHAHRDPCWSGFSVRRVESNLQEPSADRNTNCSTALFSLPERSVRLTPGGPAHPHDLACGIDAERPAIASAQRAQNGHDALVPHEGALPHGRLLALQDVR